MPLLISKLTGCTSLSLSLSPLCFQIFPGTCWIWIHSPNLIQVSQPNLQSCGGWMWEWVQDPSLAGTDEYRWKGKRRREKNSSSFGDYHTISCISVSISAIFWSGTIHPQKTSTQSSWLVRVSHQPNYILYRERHCQRAICVCLLRQNESQ